jgi:hypothetical protein
MSYKPAGHFCPGCGMQQRAFPLYPWYFCNGCLRRATDGAGRRLEFSNVGLDGTKWRYADAEDWYVCQAAICLINERPVVVTEARFGGIVAEPLTSHSDLRDHSHMDDLSSKQVGRRERAPKRAGVPEQGETPL